MTPDNPVSDRPHMPDGYGVPDGAHGMVEWAEVEARLERATVYWMATTRADGRPHVVPRWGVWTEHAFFYDGSPDTVHARNLQRNPACTLHLEDGSQAVIIEGAAQRSEPVSSDLGVLLSRAFHSKYAELGYSPEPDAWSGTDAGGLLVFRPHKAMAWFDFPGDVTRFTFAV
jgi:hypothetical protein